MKHTKAMPEETIYEHMRRQGFTRREFLEMCAVLAGAMGLRHFPTFQDGSLPAHLRHGEGLVQRVAAALESSPRLPIIWLQFQDCAGCTEAFTRSQMPTVVDLVLNQISIEYHETLSAASGLQIESNKQAVMQTYYGAYLLVLEGSVPVADGGVYCTIGGRTALEHLQEAIDGAAAVIATGNCASFGGIPKANPNPTGAKGIRELVTDQTVVNIPGCPAIPEVTTGVITYYLVNGRMPDLDALNRPLIYYGKTVHDSCVRRPFFDAGQFASSFDDDGAKQGWCLFRLGCKGPTTFNACASLKWGSGPSFPDGLSYPVQSGHPCLGCSEPNFWDAGGFYGETKKIFKTFLPQLSRSE